MVFKRRKCIIRTSYGVDDNVIAASYLHDVVEDTKYTLEDIESIFGEDIAHLVEVATEKDKSKSWEERKQEKIEYMRAIILREKLIPTADKISNIENMARNFRKKGFRDFSAFNRGEEKQEWYYRSMYESLTFNEDKQNPLFIRLEQGINNVLEEQCKNTMHKRDVILCVVIDKAQKRRRIKWQKNQNFHL